WQVRLKAAPVAAPAMLVLGQKERGAVAHQRASQALLGPRPGVQHPPVVGAIGRAIIEKVVWIEKGLLRQDGHRATPWATRKARKQPCAVPISKRRAVSLPLRRCASDSRGT